MHSPFDSFENKKKKRSINRILSKEKKKIQIFLLSRLRAFFSEASNKIFCSTCIVTILSILLHIKNKKKKRSINYILSKEENPNIPSSSINSVSFSFLLEPRQNNWTESETLDRQKERQREKDSMHREINLIVSRTVQRSQVLHVTFHDPKVAALLKTRLFANFTHTTNIHSPRCI